MIKLASLVILVAISLTSCSNTFRISVKGHNNDVVEFSEPNIIVYSAFNPCITRMSIYSVSNNEMIVWNMVAGSGGCKPLDRVIIGHSISGYTVSNISAAPGDVLRISAQDNTGRYGSSEEFHFRSRNR